MKNKKYLLIALLSVVALVFSIMILMLHKNNVTLGAVCSAIDTSNPCEKVADSGYASILGFDNSYLGIVGFSILIILSVMQLSMMQLFKDRKLLANIIIIANVIHIASMIRLACILAGITAIAFLFLQGFVIHAFCIYCTIVDIVSIGLLIIAIFFYNHK